MVKCQVLFKEGYCKSTFIVLHRPPTSDSVWPTEQLEIYKGFTAGTVSSETKENLICKQEILKAGICTKALSLYSRKNRWRIIIWEWLLEFSSGHTAVEIVFLIVVFCLVMNAWSLCSWWQQESLISFPPTSLQAPTLVKPIWSLNAAFLWLTWVAVQNTCCFSKG